MSLETNPFLSNIERRNYNPMDYSAKQETNIGPSQLTCTKHEELSRAIARVSMINTALSHLISDMEEGGHEEPEQVPTTPHAPTLANLMAQGPKELDAMVEEALAKIGYIKSMLF